MTFYLGTWSSPLDCFTTTPCRLPWLDWYRAGLDACDNNQHPVVTVRIRGVDAADGSPIRNQQLSYVDMFGYIRRDSETRPSGYSSVTLPTNPAPSSDSGVGYTNGTLHSVRVEIWNVPDISGIRYKMAWVKRWSGDHFTKTVRARIQHISSYTRIPRKFSGTGS